MVSPNVSEPVSPNPNHPNSSRRVKERSQITLWSVATLFFGLGAAVATLSVWQLHRLYRATIAPVVTVEGTLRAKYSYQDGNELSPAPSGYYVESEGLGRVYLTGKPLDGFVGQSVKALGGVSGVCGPKSVPCYPLIDVREIGIAVDDQ